MTRLDLTSHRETVQVPRLSLQPERTAEMLMHLTRVAAMSTEELLRDASRPLFHFTPNKHDEAESKISRAG